MKRVRPKATDPKRQRSKIARAEWDFRRVKAADVDRVCMVEYARECLRAWDAGDLEWTVFVRGLSRNLPDREPSPVLDAVRKGIEARAAGALPPRREPIPIVEHVPVYRARRPVKAPPSGCFVVCLQIDWRAGNKQIKGALADWLEDFVRSKDEDSEATSAYLRHLHGLTRPVEEQEELIDYCDLANAISRYGGAHEIAEEVGWPVRYVLKELRRGVGSKRGRGDAKRAMLTDLSVSRLWRAGKSAAEIGRLLGKGQLKFTEEVQIRRAVKKVRSHVRGMLFCAEFVEQAVAGKERQRKPEFPTTSPKETQKT